MLKKDPQSPMAGNAIQRIGCSAYRSHPNEICTPIQSVER